MSSEHKYTIERTHFLRGCQVNVDLYRDMYWAILIDKIPAEDLFTELHNNQSKFKGNMFQAISTLLHKHAVDRSISKDDCDVTLLYSIIRNLTSLPPPTQGWGVEPLSINISITDDVERMRLSRNKLYGHIKRAYLNETEYNKLMEEAESIVERVGRHLGVIGFKEDLGDIRYKDISDQWEKKIKELRDIEIENRERIEVHTHRIEENKERIEEDREKIEVHTERIEENREKIEENRERIEEDRERIEENKERIEENRERIEENMERREEDRGRIDVLESAVAGCAEKTDKAIPTSTSSLNIYGGHFVIGSVNNYNGTGNSSTNMIAPGSEHNCGTRMVDESVNYGGSNSLNVFNGDVEIENLNIGQSEAMRKTNSSASGGYDEIDTVQTTGHKPGPTTSLTGDFKVEHDNTLSEEIHDAINPSLKSVGMLLIDNSTGTAFRVGSKYAMTSWHVIRDHVAHLKTGQTVFHNLERINAFINFSEDPRLPIQEIFHISSTVPYFDVELDIAVVKLKTDNSINMPPALSLCTEHDEFKNVNKLNVLGFGHPDSHTKTEELATVIPPGSPRVMDAHTWVQKNEEKLKSKCRDMGVDPERLNLDYTGWYDDKNVAIDIHKEKDSSGFPALLCADASKVKVMAVVYRGLPDCFLEVPSILRLAFPTYCRKELAVKMSHIYVSMQNKNPTLTKDVFQCDETDMDQ